MSDQNYFCYLRDDNQVQCKVLTETWTKKFNTVYRDSEQDEPYVVVKANSILNAMRSARELFVPFRW